jgi:serine/threonine protein kinase
LKLQRISNYLGSKVDAGLRTIPQAEQQRPKYRLVSRLALGGMGEVFLARQEGPAGFAKTVVVKRILDSFATDESFVEMFLEEARLAALLSHPNIVQIFELGREEDAYYIAMEFIDGESLRAVNKRLWHNKQRVPPTLAARVCQQALRGLHHAHELKDDHGNNLHIIHRDVSPENILVGYSGVIKLVDFGIAKAAISASNTGGRILKGKLHYVAPELVQGESSNPRTDIYAMGVVLYESLLGTRPITGKDEAELFRAIIHTKPKSPKEVNGQIPKMLSDIVEKALAKNPTDRFATADEMSHALDHFIDATGERVGDAQLAHLMKSLYGPNATRRVAGLGTPSQPQKIPSLSPAPPPMYASAASSPPPLVARPAPSPSPAKASPLSSLRKLGRLFTGGGDKAPASHSEDLDIDVEADAKSNVPSKDLAPHEMRRLVVRGPNSSTSIVEITHSPVSIGRLDKNDVVLEHPSVPPRAATLHCDDEGWSATDVSGEMIIINGRRTEGQVLSVGDSLQFGEFELFFSDKLVNAADAPVPASAPASAKAAKPKASSRRSKGAPEGMLKVPGQFLQSAYGGEYQVATFWMDKTPVSHAQYHAYLQATGEVAPAHWLGGRPPAGLEDHPVVGVNLEGARRYAQWRGARLPTQLEWEAAARGPNNFKFPWGNEFDAALCHGPEREAQGTAPVGSLPQGASPNGCLDLVGNVWEWAELDAACEQDVDPDYVWVFGGSFLHACSEDGGIPRKSVLAEKEYRYLGFRCAWGEE